jgi:hypothetical protein
MGFARHWVDAAGLMCADWVSTRLHAQIIQGDMHSRTAAGRRPDLRFVFL